MYLFAIILLFLLLISASIAIYEYILIKQYKKNQKLMETINERLYATSEEILKAEGEDEIYSIALNTAVDLIPGADKGSILLMDENDNFHYKVVRGFDDSLIKLTLKSEEVYLNIVNKFRETAIISDPRKFDEKNTDHNTMEELKKKDALNIYSTISAPIYIDNNLIGLLNVDSSEAGHVFTKRELNLMNLIKSELQISLKNAFAQNKLKYLASFDELTGIMNRRCFNHVYDFEIKRLKTDEKLSLVFIDLDEFKNINDTYSHSLGDMVLKYFSDILKSCVRKSDVVARIAGDEFIILFGDCPIDEAKKKMESIVSLVASQKFNGISISFSYGICEIESGNRLTVNEALHLADTKMYTNKKLKGVKR